MYSSTKKHLFYYLLFIGTLLFGTINLYFRDNDQTKVDNPSALQHRLEKEYGEIEIYEMSITKQSGQNSEQEQGENQDISINNLFNLDVLDNLNVDYNVGTSNCISMTSVQESPMVPLIVLLIIPVGMANAYKNKSRSRGDAYRNAVLQLIHDQPGIHFKEICRHFEKKNGVTQYHLRILEQKNKIVSYQDGGFHRYFRQNTDPSKSLDQRAYLFQSLLARQSTGPIIQLLHQSTEPLSRKQIAQERQISLQGVSNNCKILLESQFIEEQIQIRQKYFKLSSEAISLMEVLN
jgi:hypothetical protein